MRFFLIIYAAVFIFIILQSLALRRANAEFAGFIRTFNLRFREDKTDHYDLPAGTQIPFFSVPIYGSNRLLTPADLRERPTLLVFVPPLALEFERILHTIRSPETHAVFLVLGGKEEECGNVIHTSSASDTAHPNVQILIDRDGDLARELLIAEMPAVAEIDKQGRFLGSRRLADEQIMAEGIPPFPTV
jgi:hypothetical protein